MTTTRSTDDADHPGPGLVRRGLRARIGRTRRALLVASVLTAAAAGCAPARSAESTGEPAVCDDVRRLADTVTPLLAGAAPDAASRQALHDELRAIAAASPGEVASATASLEVQLLAEPGTPVGDATTPTSAPSAAPGPASGQAAVPGSVPVGDEVTAREVVTLWALDACGLDPFQPRRPAVAASSATTGPARRIAGALDWPAVQDLVAGVHPGAPWLARDTQGTVADDPDLGVTVVVFGTDGGDQALEVCRDVRAALTTARPGATVRVRVRGPVGGAGAATAADGSCVTVGESRP